MARTLLQRRQDMPRMRIRRRNIAIPLECNGRMDFWYELEITSREYREGGHRIFRKNVIARKMISPLGTFG